MRVRGDGARVRFHFVAAARRMLGKAQPRLREREPEGLVALVLCRLRHPQAVLRVVAVNVVGTHVYAPRYAGLSATQPANLGKLVTPERAPTEKAPSNVGLATYCCHSAPGTRLQPQGLADWDGSRDCQGGRDVYVRPPCRTPRRPGIS